MVHSTQLQWQKGLFDGLHLLPKGNMLSFWKGCLLLQISIALDFRAGLCCLEVRIRFYSPNFKLCYVFMFQNRPSILEAGLTVCYDFLPALSQATLPYFAVLHP